MYLPISIAEKLLLLQKGEKISSTKLKHRAIATMFDNGILEQQVTSRNRKLIFVRHPDKFSDYLFEQFGISNLKTFIEMQNKETVTRSELIAVSADSKLRKVRTFKGFLVNCYEPIQLTINGKSITINPVSGIFQFIYDFENFIIPHDITIVGVENSENFRHIERQRYLFEHIKPLFVNRYPQNQSKDLIKWLHSTSNRYLHFGDFDFAGVGIYLNEYKKYLGDRASYYIPDNVEQLIRIHGNKSLYDIQTINFDEQTITEKSLLRMISLIHKYQKGLEQEILVRI